MDMSSRFESATVSTCCINAALENSLGVIKLLSSLLFKCLLLSVFGCTPQNSAQSKYESQSAYSGYRAAATDDGQEGNAKRLEEILHKRAHDSFMPDFALGPGDVLQISVPDVEEIKERTERVSAQGAIDLPIAGSVHVGGLTESQAKAAVIKALSKYVKDPQADIFVKEYTSRQVAVTGMVSKPGLYTLNSRDDTIMEMLGRAGGMSDQAGGSIIFIPSFGSHSSAYLKRMAEGQVGTNGNSSESSGRGTVATAEQPQRAGPEQVEKVSAWRASKNAFPTALPEDSDPIFINASNGHEGEDVPARPGDVIIVPARGEVLVAGWVKNAGAYQIAPGMTAFGAVAAAGGEMFSYSAEVLRPGSHGEKIQMPFDISKIKSGQEPDIAIRSGDVVVVKPSAVGAVPYGAWLIFSKFGTGMYLPTF
jgi:protein involved in polysaccharide export with SLBB domain